MNGSTLALAALVAAGAAFVLWKRKAAEVPKTVAPAATDRTPAVSIVGDNDPRGRMPGTIVRDHRGR